MTRDFFYILALVGALLGFNYCYDKAIKDVGARDLRIHQLDSLRGIDKLTLDSLNVVKAQDTIRLTRWLTKWRDSIRIDSFPVQVSVEVVKVIVETADSTIQACTQVINTCEQQQAVLRNTIRLGDEEISVLKKQLNPSLVTKVKTVGLWMTLGATLYAIFW